MILNSKIRPERSPIQSLSSVVPRLGTPNTPSFQAFTGSDADFDTVEETGGAKTVASSAQTFAGDALASHQHAAISAGTPAGTNGTVAASGSAVVKVGTSTSSAAASGHTHSGPTFTGSPMATHQHDGITAGTPSGTNTPGAATSVVQPYLVVYMWKRTA